MPGEITPGPIALFYSYSHKDESLRDEMAKHLTTLQRAGFIREWYDRELLAGDEWDRQISTHVETAEVILLLISADFLASRYCYDVEAKRALERHAAGSARVIPIVLRPVVWNLTPFAALQALPANARAVTEWPNPDLAFVNICEGILAIVVAWKGNASYPGRNAEQEPDRPPSSPRLVRARKRVLDAAMPKGVQTGKATTLVVMLRRESSSGLRAVVEVEKSYGVAREDVRSTPSFRLEFPFSADGKLAPLELELRVRAPDFEPQVQTKSISVHPRGDSEPKVFLLTPNCQGELVLTVQLCQGEKEITSCLLRTNGWASEQEIGHAGHTLVSVPLDSPQEGGQEFETYYGDASLGDIAREMNAKISKTPPEHEAPAAPAPSGLAPRPQQSSSEDRTMTSAPVPPTLGPSPPTAASSPISRSPAGAYAPTPGARESDRKYQPRLEKKASFRYVGLAAAVVLFATVGSFTYLHMGGRQAPPSVTERTPADAAPTAVADGQLEFSTNPPGAEVRVDGKFVGLSPVTAKLPAGIHRYQITLKGHRTQIGAVEIARGSRVQKTLDLEPAP
jgi:hypothetical protein